MALLSTAEVNAIREDIREVIGDDTISTDVVYRQSGTTVSDWNPTIGSIPDMYTNSSVSAFKSSYTLEEIQDSGGMIEYGDVKFILMTDDVSGICSVDDMIMESASTWQSATTHQIKSVSRDPLNIAYFLRVRKMFDKQL